MSHKMFVVNGFEISAYYSDSAIENIFIPLLEHWSKMFSQSKKRIVISLSAPPGTGKSTLALFLEHLSRITPGVREVQAIGLDGFHYHSDYIKSHNAVIDGGTVPMAKVKGCPETFDIEKLKIKLEELKNSNILWPLYDRSIHDVVEDAVKVDKDIVLLEGNWLLLSEEPWAELIDFCDYSIFISADAPLLHKRLVDRKIQGGLSPAAAEEFYQNSDLKNIYRLMANHHTADTELTLCPDGDLELNK